MESENINNILLIFQPKCSCMKFQIRLLTLSASSIKMLPCPKPSRVNDQVLSIIQDDLLIFNDQV